MGYGTGYKRGITRRIEKKSDPLTPRDLTDVEALTLFLNGNHKTAQATLEHVEGDFMLLADFTESDFLLIDGIGKAYAKKLAKCMSTVKRSIDKHLETRELVDSIFSKHGVLPAHQETEEEAVTNAFNHHVFSRSYDKLPPMAPLPKTSQQPDTVKETQELQSKRKALYSAFSEFLDRSIRKEDKPLSKSILEGMRERLPSDLG